MYMYCLDCDVNVTNKWIKFEKKKQLKTKQYLPTQAVTIETHV